MKIIDAIRQRRSVGRVKPDPVPKELIAEILEAAVWAPNHYRTEPWRFVVMTGEGRKRLSRALVDIAAQGMEDAGSEENQRLLRLAEQKAFRAPVVIAVAAHPSDRPEVCLVEELAAVHAAIQNMLLAAASLGLGAMWRTGAPAYHPLMKDRLGLPESCQVAGFVYVGYPDISPPPGIRTPAEEKTVWYDS
jgi:nitroreductase